VTQPPNFPAEQPTTQPGVHTSGFAIASLVLGILSLPAITMHLGGTGLFAVLCGYAARSEIRHGRATGDGLAVAGLILGYLALGITIIMIVTDNF